MNELESLLIWDFGQVNGTAVAAKASDEAKMGVMDWQFYARSWDIEKWVRGHSLRAGWVSVQQLVHSTYFGMTKERQYCSSILAAVLLLLDIGNFSSSTIGGVYEVVRESPTGDLDNYESGSAL